MANRQGKSYRKPGPDEILIWRPWITRKDGTRLYAYQLGIRAFPIIVKRS